MRAFNLVKIITLNLFLSKFASFSNAVSQCSTEANQKYFTTQKGDWFMHWSHRKTPMTRRALFDKIPGFLGIY